MKQLDAQLAKDLLDSPYGKDLAKFVAETILELDTFSGIVIGEPNFILLSEMRARQITVRTLRHIFDELIKSENYAIMSHTNKDYQV